jgi:hypothetical protein
MFFCILIFFGIHGGKIGRFKFLILSKRNISEPDATPWQKKIGGKCFTTFCQKGTFHNLPPRHGKKVLHILSKKVPIT